MDRGASMGGGSKRLRPWLLEQIESGAYPGLRWEDEERSTFRIPWKHAAKHDYCQQEDAALFKGWALFKGKFRQGDRPDPPAWKTRLRCALNKSSDFEEVSERSQLDISEPYKVYRVLPEGARGRGETDDEDDVSNDKMNIINANSYPTHRRHVDSNHEFQKRPYEHSSWYPHQGDREMFGIPMMTANKNLISNFHSPAALYEMDIVIKYKDERVLCAHVVHPLGCRLAFHPGSPGGHDPATGTVRFPPPAPGRRGELLAAALASLGRGLTLRVEAESGRLRAERLCRGRVYWSGPCAPRGATGGGCAPGRPNKMERREPLTVFDRERFMGELHSFMQGAPEPQTEVVLCFCEEYPGGSLQQKKLVTAHVELVFARQLLENAKRQRDAVGPLGRPLAGPLAGPLTGPLDTGGDDGWPFLTKMKTEVTFMSPHRQCSLPSMEL